jgi:hypothetical protein
LDERRRPNVTPERIAELRSYLDGALPPGYADWAGLTRVRSSLLEALDEIERLRAENERLLALLRKCREAFMHVPPATAPAYATGGTVSEPIPVRVVPYPGLLAEIDAALGVRGDG